MNSIENGLPSHLRYPYIPSHYVGFFNRLISFFTQQQKDNSRHYHSLLRADLLALLKSLDKIDQTTANLIEPDLSHIVVKMDNYLMYNTLSAALIAHEAVANLLRHVKILKIPKPLPLG